MISGILAFLLFQQKSKRIETQLKKKELGWNPVAIKRMVLIKSSNDSLTLSKKDGVWKSDQKFDADGVAPQLLVYLSTMQITPKDTVLASNYQWIVLKSFDKNDATINTIEIGGNIAAGRCLAKLNGVPKMVILSNKLNKESLYDLVKKLY